MTSSFGALPVIALCIAVLALGCSIYLYFLTRDLQRLKIEFFKGKNGRDLETILLALSNELQSLLDREDVAEQAIQQLQHHITFTMQKVGVVRYNPFGDGGGNFSFSIALLDGHNSGLVITSLYGREQNRVYAKRIQQGASETQLTEEEEKAVNVAQNSKTHETRYKRET